MVGWIVTNVARDIFLLNAADSMFQSWRARNSPLANQALIAFVRLKMAFAINLTIGIAVGMPVCTSIYAGRMRDRDLGKVVNFGEEPGLSAIGQVTIGENEHGRHKADSEPDRFKSHIETICRGARSDD